MSGTESGLSCLRLLASVQLNSNMSESLRHLCVPPCVRCVHCVPCLPLYVFHCAKIDSVLTQPTQGKKRIVGARLYMYNVNRGMLSAHHTLLPNMSYNNRGRIYAHHTLLPNMYNENRGMLSAHHTLLPNMYNDNRGRLSAHHTSPPNMYHDNWIFD